MDEELHFRGAGVTRGEQTSHSVGGDGNVFNHICAPDLITVAVSDSVTCAAAAAAPLWPGLNEQQNRTEQNRHSASQRGLFPSPHFQLFTFVCRAPTFCHIISLLHDFFCLCTAPQMFSVVAAKFLVTSFCFLFSHVHIDSLYF